VSDRVLIADSDRMRGKAIAEACAERGVRCDLVVHGAEALEAALVDRPSALIAQLGLPLIDGPRLGSILRSNPHTEDVVVLYLADHAADEKRVDLDGEILLPPVDPERVARRVQVLLMQRNSDRNEEERGRAVEPGGVEGQIAQLPLSDLLELFHASRRTGVIELGRTDASGEGQSGRVLMQSGDVIHAETAGVEGAKALFRLLAWDRGNFAFRPEPVPDVARIKASTRTLLREGLRQIKEWERLAFALPAGDAHARLRTKRGALPNVIHPLTQEVLSVLAQHSRVRDVVDACTFPDYQVLRTLHTLIERGVVELGRGPMEFGERADAALFTPDQVRHLRDWLETMQPNGGGGDAKLLVVASDDMVIGELARLLSEIPDVELDARLAAGALSSGDLATLARVRVGDDLGIEIVNLPRHRRFEPVWPLAGHHALGTVFLLSTPVADAIEATRGAESALRKLPRARVFHVAFIDKDEEDAMETLRQNVALLEEGSLFLIPIGSDDKARVLLRDLFARVLP
jgi:CheY-like chemotaxis protein